MSSLDKIIKDIINDAPIGELSKVVEDLRLIVDKNIDHELTEAIKQYNLNNYISIKVNDKSIILSKFNYDSTNDEFIDETQGLKFKVDYLNQNSYDIVEIEPINNKHVKELNEYVLNHYENGEFLISNDKLIIKGFKSSPENYYTGSWRCFYDLSQGHNEINIEVHYYEDGNVKLQNEFKDLDFDSNDLIKSITKIENNVQISINKEFQVLNEDIFKKLRRQLPITRSKINWGKSIGNYKLGKNINH